MKIRSGFSIAALIISSALASAAPANAATNICIAYDTGGLGDRSFNDATLAGVKKAQNQFTFTFEGVVTDGTLADRTKRLRSLTAKNCATIIAVGGEYAKAVAPLAIEFPNIQFAIIGDASIAALNVTSITFADIEGAFLAGYSAALTTKSGKVAMITTPSSADNYQNGFLAGVSAAKKNVRSFVKFTATDLDFAAQAFISLGIDVIYTATSGSADSVFDAIVKANTSKSRKKSAADINLILTEPDLYLTVTPANSKYLLASIVKRVDIAVSDVIGRAVNKSQLSDVIDPKAGIYGHRYTIADKGIEIVIKSKTLAAQSAAINAAASAAYAR
jgi:basic membrane protein A and related proteins